MSELVKEFNALSLTQGVQRNIGRSYREPIKYCIKPAAALYLSSFTGKSRVFYDHLNYPTCNRQV